MLHGLARSVSLGVFLPDSPFAPRPDAVARAFTQYVPLEFQLNEDHPVSLADGERRHRLDLDIREADSKVPIRAVRLHDGYTVVTESGLWPTSLDLPAGNWRIICGGGFSFEAETVVETSVPREGHAPLVISLTSRQGAFAVRTRDAPGARKARLVIPGFEKEIRLSAIEWVPKTGPAALVITEPYYQLIPASADEEGNRFVDLPQPTPHPVSMLVSNPEGRLMIPEVELDTGDQVLLGRSTNGFLVFPIFSVGRIKLTFSAPGHLSRTLTRILRLPPSGIDLGTIVLHPEEALRTRTFRLLTGEGEPVPEFEIRPVDEDHELDGADSNGKGAVEIDLVEDIPVVFFDETHFPLPAVLTPDGPTEFRLPAGKIVVEASGADGKPMPAVVTLDGFSFDLGESGMVIQGVPGGTHTLVFWIAGRPAVIKQIALSEGETMPVRLQLE